MELKTTYHRRVWDAKAKEGTSMIRSTLILQAPDLSGYSNVVVNSVQFALESFLLDYAVTEESCNDVWYYSHLKEQLFDDDGYPNLNAFLFESEGREFQRDPQTRFKIYFDTVAAMFEEVVALNAAEIELLYDTINIRELNVNIHTNFIVVSIKGTPA